MLGSIRTGVAAGILVLFGTTGMFHSPAGAAKTRAGLVSVVEFTPDDKTKRSEGYREWIDIGTPRTPNEMNCGAPPDPGDPRRRLRSEELRLLQEVQ